MLLYRLWNYLRGYVIIYIENISHEKIINLFKRKNITVWDVKRKNKGIQLIIESKSYNKEKELIINTGAIVIKKCGLLFSLSKLKRRKGFTLGIALLVVCVLYFCSFIWNIEIIGNESITNNQIIDALEQNNITVPLNINKINDAYIENILYENFESLKFAEVYIEGTNLLVYLKEKKKIDYFVEDNYPSNIIAKKDAVINKIIVKNGEKLVKEGDVVVKGQTLINGVVESQTGEKYLVHSDGIVFGQTYYNLILKEEKVQNISLKTDKKKSTYYLCFNEKKYKIYDSKSKPKEYIKESKTIHIPVLSSLFRICLFKDEYYQTEIKTVNVDKTYIKNKLTIKLYEELYKYCGDNSSILQNNIEFCEDETYFFLKAKVEMLERIGETARINDIEEE